MWLKKCLLNLMLVKKSQVYVYMQHFILLTSSAKVEYDLMRG